jgi:hypothetical protein
LEKLKFHLKGGEASPNYQQALCHKYAVLQAEE